MTKCAFAEAAQLYVQVYDTVPIKVIRYSGLAGWVTVDVVKMENTSESLLSCEHTCTFIRARLGRQTYVIVTTL